MLYIQKGYRKAFERYSNESAASKVLQYLSLVDQFRKAESEAAIINLIILNGIIDHCPDKFLKSHEVSV